MQSNTEHTSDKKLSVRKTIFIPHGEYCTMRQYITCKWYFVWQLHSMMFVEDFLHMSGRIST